MKKTYAVAPEGCSHYLTPGKMYEVTDDNIDEFYIIDDDGDKLHCLWKGCAYAAGDWERVEDNSPAQTQIGGDHYLKMKIQPLEFAMANGLDACQTKIIKYICRDKSSKLEDLEKARHVLDYYIDWVKNNV